MSASRLVDFAEVYRTGLGERYYVTDESHRLRPIPPTKVEATMIKERKRREALQRLYDVVLGGKKLKVSFKGS